MTKPKTLLITKTRKYESTKEEIYSEEIRDCYGAGSFERAEAYAFYPPRLIFKDQRGQDKPSGELFKGGARDTKGNEFNFSCFLNFACPEHSRRVLS